MELYLRPVLFAEAIKRNTSLQRALTEALPSSKLALPHADGGDEEGGSRELSGAAGADRRRDGWRERQAPASGTADAAVAKARLPRGPGRVRPSRRGSIST